MARKSKGKFTMKGHTLPGINQKSETTNLKDGRSPSSAFQMNERRLERLQNKKDRLRKKLEDRGSKGKMNQWRLMDRIDRTEDKINKLTPKEDPRGPGYPGATNYIFNDPRFEEMGRDKWGNLTEEEKERREIEEQKRIAERDAINEEHDLDDFDIRTSDDEPWVPHPDFVDFADEGVIRNTSPLPQKEKYGSDDKVRRKETKRRTGLIKPKELTHEERLAEQKKADKKGTGFIQPKDLTHEERLVEQKKADKQKRGTGLKI